MKHILSFLFALLFVWSATAQHSTNRTSTTTTLSATNTSAPVAYDIDLDGPFLAYYLKMDSEIEGLAIRFSADAQTWSEWTTIELDSHQEEGDVGVISQLQFIAIEQAGFYQLQALENYAGNIRCDFFNPGFSRPSDNRPQLDDITLRSCPCPLPNYQNRNDWCPNGQCPEIQNPTYTDVSHLIVHHAAGTNVSDDWAAVVRSIWDFHVNGNEWDDVGYNWLIDPNGVIYQGRGDNVRGAHFCGMNTNTMGVCLLGNYTDITPTTSTRTSLKELLAWKCCDKDLPALGEGVQASSGMTFMHISGHRDGCSTACPGDAFYPQMPDVRQDVFDHIVTGCSGLSGATQLVANLTGSTEATLEWQDNTEGELGYLIERKEIGEDFSHYATVGTDIVTYIDNAIDDTSFYTYRIRAYTAADTSAYSNEATVGEPVAIVDPFLNAHTISTFPNPTKEVLNIQIDNTLLGHYEIAIINILGEIVLQSSMTKLSPKASIELSVADLPQGSYQAIIVSESHSVGIPFVKQ